MPGVNFTLVSPEKHVLTVDVDMVVVPGEEGNIGVLPNHAALISTIRPGIVTTYQGDSKRHIFVSGGFANITEESCIVLAEKCQPVDEMNLLELELKSKEIDDEIEIARSDREREELSETQKIIQTQIHLLKKLGK